MERVVVFGAGKSAMGRQLSESTGVPFVELDAIFWNDQVQPKSRNEWIELQQRLVQDDSWILEGDLGPYDSPEVRIEAADTIILIDLPRWRCIWRSALRSRQRMDYWRWVRSWRRTYRPQLMAIIERSGSRAKVHVLSSTREARRFVSGVRR